MGRAGLPAGPQVPPDGKTVARRRLLGLMGLGAAGVAAAGPSGLLRTVLRQEVPSTSDPEAAEPGSAVKLDEPAIVWAGLNSSV